MYIGIITGIIAGFLAFKLYGGEGKGCLVDMVLGIVGGFLGGWLGEALNMQPTSWLGELVIAVAGAVIFLWFWNKVIK